MADFNRLGTTVQRDDQSGFITADGATVSVMGFYSDRGTTLPFYTSDPTDWTNEYGDPNAAITYAGYCARKPLEQGDGIWNLRITDGATYGGAFITTAGATAVGTSLYDSAGWPYATDAGNTTSSPVRPQLIQLKFSADLVALNSFVCTIVGDSVQAATTPVVYASTSDATMTAIAAAIQSALTTNFNGGTAVVNETTAIRTINVIPPAGQTLTITGAAVTLGASQATVTQAAPLLAFQDANPGAKSSELGFFLSNPDLGQREVNTLTFSGPLATGHSMTVTVNGVGGAEVSYVTSSDNTMQLIADAIVALPTVKSATVTKVASGASNDRVITVILQDATATAATISVTPGGSSPPSVVVRQTKAGVDPDGSFTLSIFDKRNPAVVVDAWRVNLTERLDGDGQQQHIEEVINKGAAASRRLRVISYAPKDGSVRIPFDPDTGVIMNSVVYLSSGNAGTIPSASRMSDAMLVFKDTNRFPADLLLSAGYTSIAYQQTLKNIANLRGDGTLAILDIPSSQQRYEDLISYHQSVLAIDDSSAAAYYPDVEMEDPVTRRKLFVPPSGHVAAVYGVNDRVRGFGKAPAGRKVGVVDTENLRFEYDIDQITYLARNCQLNGITRKGSTFCVWGDFTRQSRKSALQFVSISRMVGKLEFAVATMLDWRTFDPYNDAQALSIKEEIARFLDPYITSEDINGYTVNTTASAGNTPGLEDQGKRIVEMKIDPTRSTRSILLRSILTRAGVTTTVTEVG